MPRGGEPAKPEPKPVFLVDSSIYIFRSYFSLGSHWQSKEGLPTEAVYGFAAFLLRLLLNERPVYVAAAFDESLGSGFRHQIYPGYKSNREQPDEQLAFQLNACQAVADALGFPVFASETYEADDLLATLAALSESGGGQPRILSRDKDLGQLLGNGRLLWDYGYGEPLDEAAFTAAKGVAPSAYPHLQALTGDPIDAIPGVPGIGPKTAAALVNHFGTVDRLLETTEEAAGLAVRGAAKLPARIMEHSDQIRVSLALTSLVADIPLSVELRELRWRGIDPAAAETLFRDLGISGLFKRVRQLCE